MSHRSDRLREQGFFLIEKKPLIPQWFGGVFFFRNTTSMNHSLITKFDLDVEIFKAQLCKEE